ncbi:hypothetical protein Q3G72_006414 [Acer saccharum]|nr:hypothetical protein Q3G72_006414 [Acer saccharum]
MITLSQLLNKTNSPWNPNIDPCKWERVNCSGSSITHLSLSGFGLSSSEFLPVVCNISSLQALDVSNNQLSSIPNDFIRTCGGINGFKLLNFSRNSFDGYSFDGSIPTNLGKSKALEQLEFSVNNFQNVIPDQIADFRNLTLIDLSVNQLSGSIPHRIGELSKLEVLILSENNLNGGIPANLSNIATLSRFAANENNFSGQIPDGLTRYLKNLDLSYNKLSGLIPPELLSQPNLQTVDMSYNKLEGPIPKEISSSLVRLRLGSNSLSRGHPVFNMCNTWSIDLLGTGKQ